MKQFNIHQAKTHLSRLIEEVAAGEEVIIAKAGKPMARLVAASTESGPRVLGRLAGAVRETADCWAPDAEIEALFYGEVEPPAVRRVAESKPRKRGRR